MKFGVREICDVVFKAKKPGKLGTYSYNVGQPVLYIDSAKTSAMEGGATSVYATGGKGNSRLIAWEGEKTLTFTVEDALLSPIGFHILSGAGLLNGGQSGAAKIHKTQFVSIKGSAPTFNLEKERVDITEPVFIMEANSDDSLTGRMFSGYEVNNDEGNDLAKFSGTNIKIDDGELDNSKTYWAMVDYYVTSTAAATELVIDAGSFGGNYYVEAATLFKRQSDGKDLAAEIIFPNVKVQSNFTFNMAATGDPSTFSFVMDAMPGKVVGKEGDVLCVIQIIDEDAEAASAEATAKDSILTND